MCPGEGHQMLMRLASILLRSSMLILQLVGSAGSRLVPNGVTATAVCRRLPMRVRYGLVRALSDGLPVQPEREPQRDSAFREALALHQRLEACTDARLGGAVREALGVLRDALRLYGPYGVYGSYNGGKDAVVIMHLLRAAVAAHCDATATAAAAAAGGAQPAPAPAKPQLIYFHDAREFPEVEAFVHKTVAEVDAHMFRYEKGIIEGLGEHIERMRRSHAARGTDVLADPPSFAFVLGTRVGDPNCKGQTPFVPSSDWMPPFMCAHAPPRAAARALAPRLKPRVTPRLGATRGGHRAATARARRRVNPILTWDYGLVWSFLRAFDLPYCSLYDAGYTSLGTLDDTKPNPALSDGAGGYRPAYELSDYSLERAGRVERKPKPKAGAAAGAPSEKPSAAAPSPPPPVAPPPPQVPRSRSSRGPPSPSRRTTHARTAGLVVIGDELLKGKVTDTNTAYAIGELRRRGIDVRRVSVLPDDLDDIQREIRAQATACDLVITSGGVGPTHDDVTLRALALALNQPIEHSAVMAAIIRDATGVDELTPEQAKMTMLPTGVRLRKVPTSPGDSAEPSRWPILQAENVFVLPGVPSFFRAKLDQILAHFVATDRAVYTRTLVRTPVPAAPSPSPSRARTRSRARSMPRAHALRLTARAPPLARARARRRAPARRCCPRRRRRSCRSSTRRSPSSRPSPSARTRRTRRRTSRRCSPWRVRTRRPWTRRSPS